jgi:hypothetical protein
MNWQETIRTVGNRGVRISSSRMIKGPYSISELEAIKLVAQKSSKPTITKVVSISNWSLYVEAVLATPGAAASYRKTKR